MTCTTLALRGLIASLLLAGSAWLHAAPDVAAVAASAPAAAGDAVLQLLHEKGLLPAAGTSAAPAPDGLVQQVRDAASELVMSAMNFLGVRYRRGGNSAEQGFDCSGFTRYVFEHSVGLVLPRRADQQARGAGLMAIARDQLKPGDLVFFNTMRRAFSHVGIYIGEGKFIHAPRPGGEVRIEDMHASYWSRRFSGARRAELPSGDSRPATAPADAQAAAPATTTASATATAAP